MASQTLRPSWPSECFDQRLQFFTLSSRNTLPASSPGVVNLHHFVLKVNFWSLLRTRSNFFFFSSLEKHVIDAVVTFPGEVGERREEGKVLVQNLLRATITIFKNKNFLDCEMSYS